MTEWLEGLSAIIRTSGWLAPLLALMAGILLLVSSPPVPCPLCPW